MKILIVDDELSARLNLSSILEVLGGVEITEATNLEEARRELARVQPDVALVDIRLSREDMRNQDGLTLVGEIRGRTTTVPVVVTGSNEMALIRRAMRMGAYDYILKDELCEELVAPVINGLRDRQRLEDEFLRQRARRAEPGRWVGDSPASKQLKALIQRLALSLQPVLVTGPTGAGKELVVQSIHELGPRQEEPLLDINCGAIPEHLMESQLFGHEKGAFTGADRRHEGFFKAVGRGTLFLDEIAEMPLLLQAKLLRVLETQRFRPVGSTNEEQFQGRIIAATHADLEQRVNERRFREDLLFRLNVLEVRVPSLEERREDIPTLLQHFIRKQPRPLQFTPETVSLLCRRSWPGNVRQLRNLVNRLAVLSEEDLITPQALDTLAGREKPSLQAQVTLETLVDAVLDLPLPNKLEEVERSLINRAMEREQGNKSAAARLLGVHRKAIERRLDKWLPPGDEGSGAEIA
jgi:DNA-binding NtrC family response regulator